MISLLQVLDICILLFMLFTMYGGDNKPSIEILVILYIYIFLWLKNNVKYKEIHWSSN